LARLPWPAAVAVVKERMVDFDKSKHLADSIIKQRSEVREKLVQKEREKHQNEMRKKELEELQKSSEM